MLPGARADRHLSVVDCIALPAGVRDGCAHFAPGLLAGPSRASLDEHIRARASYFGEGIAEFQERYAAFDDASAGAGSVRVWGIEDWRSRLALAFLCAQRVEKATRGTLTIVDLPSVGLVDGACCGAPIRTKRKARPHDLTEEESDAGAAFWRSFTSPDARVVLGHVSWTLFPEPEQFVDYLEAHAPRDHGGRKQLSAIDASLLAAAGGRPIGVLDLFDSPVPAHLPARQLIHCGGDLTLARRLEAWSHYPKNAPALVRENDTHLLATKYRLTPSGEALLDELPSLDAAPPFLIGGTTMYDSARPFYVPC